MAFDVIGVHGPGAEDVLVGLSGRDEGAVFTGTADGRIHRVSADGARVETVADTGGRPLGLEWLPDGRLLVCDAHRGLLAVDLARADVHGQGVEVLATDAGGRRMVFCNNAAVGSDGSVWFSDSSALHGIDAWKADIVEDTRTGRLLRRTPDGSVQVVLEGLAFANGVALAVDESWVAVAETAARTVARHWLTGPRAGQRDLLLADLPGYPDNIARGSDGLLWVTIASPRDPLVEKLQTGPMWLRRNVTRMPAALQPAPKRTIRVQAYDDAGRLVRDVRLERPDDRARYHVVTGVREHDGTVWMGSLEEPAVARYDL
ncbi:MAG: SMP-30/gluconolactonase/LRE family protein [Candidatus Nanopelagicales bacterium]